jgi:hypothetical protein
VVFARETCEDKVEAGTDKQVSSSSSSLSLSSPLSSSSPLPSPLSLSSLAVSCLLFFILSEATSISIY